MDTICLPGTAEEGVGTQLIGRFHRIILYWSWSEHLRSVVSVDPSNSLQIKYY